MKKLVAILLLFSVLITGVQAQVSVKGTLSLLYPSWTEGIAITYLAKTALEDKGYTVKTTLIEPGPLYAALAKGDADLYLDTWLPNTHKDYWARYGDKLESLGVVFDDAISGLVVPSYVAIGAIEELNAHKAAFEGKIYGIGAGAGLHGQTLRAIKAYGLDYQQITSSESSMMAALKKAVAEQKNIVITGWKPHYMWRLYELKALSDPQGLFPIDEIRIIGRKGFSSDQPEVTTFLKNFVLTEALLYELIDDVGEDIRNPHNGAKVFYEKHKAMMAGWWRL